MSSEATFCWFCGIDRPLDKTLCLQCGRYSHVKCVSAASQLAESQEYARKLKLKIADLCAERDEYKRILAKLKPQFGPQMTAWIKSSDGTEVFSLTADEADQLTIKRITGK